MQSPFVLQKKLANMSLIVSSLVLFRNTRFKLSLSKDDLKFYEIPPKQIEIECPICFCIMLRDPHLTTCCGHHFCGLCISRVKRSCPFCKSVDFSSFLDKNRLRIINGLKVYCLNHEECLWNGDLKDLEKHLDKGQRNGECEYERVKCKHERCDVKKQRRYMEKHELEDCDQRMVFCKFCSFFDTCELIKKVHF